MDPHLPNETFNLKKRPEQIHIHCSECRKPFLLSTLGLPEGWNRFECNSCGALFQVQYPECLQSLPIIGETLRLPRSRNEGAHANPTPETRFQLKSEFPKGVGFEGEAASFSCPKCNQSYKSGEKECLRCGLVFEKQKQENSISASRRLRDLWEKVIIDYENLMRHQDFFNACQEEDNFAYASYRYGRILKAYSGDALARKMVRQIEEVSLVPMGLRGLKRKPQKKWGAFFLSLMTISVAMIGIGFSLPQFRNMVGVGVAIIFLSLAVRFYFDAPSR